MALTEDDKQWFVDTLKAAESRLLAAFRASPMARIVAHQDTVAEIEDRLRHSHMLLLDARLDALADRVTALEGWKDGKA